MLFKDLIPASRNSVPGERRRLDPFHAMQREMNRMFEDVWRDFDLPSLGSDDGRFQPRVDVSETEKAVEVTAELPGMEEKDVSVMFADGVLTIEGSHAAETEEKDDNKRYHLRECRWGTFRRQLPVGERVDESKIKATFKNGRLNVRMPKTKEAAAQVKKIPISK